MMAPALPGFLAIMRDASSAIRARCSAMDGIEVPFVGCLEWVVEEGGSCLLRLPGGAWSSVQNGREIPAGRNVLRPCRVLLRIWGETR
jgi:hypothetical protein